MAKIVEFPGSTRAMWLASELSDQQIALMERHPRYLEVVMALLPNGDQVKITGHLRELLWKTGRARPPERPLRVTMFRCADMAETEELYDHFNGEDGWPRLWMHT